MFKRRPPLLPVLCLAFAALALTGCEEIENLIRGFTEGSTAAVQGSIDYQGNVPANEITVSLKVYGYLDGNNQEAFSPQRCPAGTGPDSINATNPVPECLGELDVADLTTLAVESTVSGGNTVVNITGIPIDAGYVLVADASAEGANCTQDIVGYNPETKLVDRQSSISPLQDVTQRGNILQGLEQSLSNFDFDSFLNDGTVQLNLDLPRPVLIRCDRPEDPAPQPEPAPQPPPDDDMMTEDGDIPAPETPAWSQFELRDKGGMVIADASTMSVPGDDMTPPCGDSIPYEVFGTLDNATGTTAYIHIQEGRGSQATIRDQVVELTDGKIEGQIVQLSGGYARLQLDTEPAETSSYTNTSNVIEVCSPEDAFQWPAQEILVVNNWDTANTDVDIHMWILDSSGMTEKEYIWYANRVGNEAELDVDDRDGFGPETITTNPGVSGNTYVFKSHFYYKPASADPTNVSVRVIYANQEANVYCDYTKTINDFQNRDIQDVGTFGPALAELATSDPMAFGALGCIQPGN